MSDNLPRIWRDILTERQRQDARHDGGIERHAAEGDHLLALAVLTEEVGEVAQEVLGNRYGLRDELIQVAAVAVAWVQAIDGGSAR